MEEGRRSESEGSTLEEVNSGKEGLFRRKDVDVRVKGGHWGKLAQGREDYFGGRTGKVTQGKKDYSRLVE